MTPRTPATTTQTPHTQTTVHLLSRSRTTSPQNAIDSVNEVVHADSTYIPMSADSIPVPPVCAPDTPIMSSTATRDKRFNYQDPKHLAVTSEWYAQPQNARKITRAVSHFDHAKNELSPTRVTAYNRAEITPKMLIVRPKTGLSIMQSDALKSQSVMNPKLLLGYQVRTLYISVLFCIIIPYKFIVVVS